MSKPKALWRAPLLKALHLNRAKSEARYIQIATVDNDLCAQVRTVVFRGFYNEDTLTIHSDRRSRKNHELNNNDKCSVCWYFTKTREQFRFQLQAKIIDNDDPQHQSLVKQHWHNLSTAARTQYAGPHPASVINESSLSDLHSSSSPDLVDSNFSLILLLPIHVDYLDLRPNPQSRILYHHSGGTWLEQAVHP